MAWTAPRTWVTGEVVSAAIMNTHARDNLLETAPAKVTTLGDTVIASAANALARAAGTRYAFAGADQSLVNTTFVNFTGMAFDVVASGIYAFTVCITVAGASGTGGLKIQFTGPSTPTSFLIGWRDAYSGNGHVISAFSSSVTIGTGGAMSDGSIFFTGALKNGANAGTVQLQVAQDATNGATPVKDGSWIQYARLE